MNSTKIITFDYLRNNSLAHVKVSSAFKLDLKNRILNKYRTLSRYNYNREKLNINLHTLALEFRKNRYFKFDRILKIIKDFNISEEELYNEISAFFARGSNTSKELLLNKELEIDEFFVEGYALYLAEGDNGYNGKEIPRKVRFTNSKLTVHKHFVKWLRTYFPNNYFYLKVLIPQQKVFTQQDKDFIREFFGLEENQIKIKECIWKRKTRFVYRTCLDNALLIDFILSIESKIKELCSQDPKLAAAYMLI